MCRGFFFYKRNQKYLTLFDIQITLFIFFVAAFLVYYFIFPERQILDIFVILAIIEAFIFIGQCIVVCCDGFHNNYELLDENSSGKKSQLERSLNI